MVVHGFPVWLNVFKYLCSGSDMSKVHSEVDDIPDLGITQKLRKMCMLW